MFGDVIFWVAIGLGSGVFGFLSTCVIIGFFCSNPDQKMHYYSSLDSISKWELFCNVKTACVFPYHKQKKFVFEPKYNPEGKSKKIALNGWTNTKNGSAHFFTQDRNVFDTQCRLLKKQNIHHRTLINGLWLYPGHWQLSILDIEVDQDLSVVWGRMRSRLCCLPRLVSALYTIEVYPEWCDDIQYEEMCGIIGIPVKKTA